MGTNARSNRGPIEARLEVWRNRFREFSAGGSTVEQFCRQVGITAATFYYWKKKLADADAARPAPVQPVSDQRASVSGKIGQGGDAPGFPGSFMPVRIARAVVAHGDVVIRLPSGAQVQIPASASEVITAVIAQVCYLNAAATIEVA